MGLKPTNRGRSEGRILRSSSKASQRLEAELAVHTRAECGLRDHVTLGRWLPQTSTGRLVIDKKAIAAEAKLDGKYL